MNIDYEAITKKAAARRDALQQLQALVQKYPDIREKIHEFTHYGAQLRLALNAVDAEGKELLGWPLVFSLDVLETACRYPGTQLLHPRNESRAGSYVADDVLRKALEG